MNRMNVDIFGISEIRWTGVRSFKFDGYIMLYLGGQNHERGVGILFNQASSSSLMDCCPVSHRVLLTKVNTKPLTMHTIQACTSTSSSSEGTVEIFYEDIETTKNQCKSREVTVIMGEFNATVGNKLEDITVRPYGLGK